MTLIERTLVRLQRRAVRRWRRERTEAAAERCVYLENKLGALER